MVRVQHAPDDQEMEERLFDEVFLSTLANAETPHPLPSLSTMGDPDGEGTSSFHVQMHRGI